MPSPAISVKCPTLAVLDVFFHDFSRSGPRNTKEVRLGARLRACPRRHPADGLLSVWNAVYSSATTGRAAKDATAAQRRAALLSLKDQLFDNLLALARMFKNDEEKANLYCPQHLREDPKHTPTPTLAPTPTPP